MTPIAPSSPLRREVPAGSHFAGEPRQDFDFLHGEWIVENQQLSSSGLVRWRTFHTIHTCRPLLGGLANVEEAADESGESRVALRVFDISACRWAIYRMSPVHAVAGDPLYGGFEDGVGVFVGEARRGNQPVVVREVWTGTATDRPLWEQACSTDGGATWETTWRMAFERVHW